jgi:hypothetical protein
MQVAVGVTIALFADRKWSALVVPDFPHLIRRIHFQTFFAKRGIWLRFTSAGALMLVLGIRTFASCHFSSKETQRQCSWADTTTLLDSLIEAGRSRMPRLQSLIYKWALPFVVDIRRALP